LLRFERPIQYTSRLAPNDVEMGGKTIRKGQAVIAIMAAANRDPERFPEPDRLDLARENNRHLAFALDPLLLLWGAAGAARGRGGGSGRCCGGCQT
jgi:cytochrome P450